LIVLLDLKKIMLDTVAKKLGAPHLDELERFGGKLSKFGVNFAVCTADGGLELFCEGGEFKSDTEQLVKWALEALRKNGAQNGITTEAEVCQFGEYNQVLAAVPRSGAGSIGFAALIDLGEKNARQDRKYEIRDAYFSEMLVLLAEKFQTTACADEQIEMISTELAKVYEELVLLHKLSTNMKVTESDANFLQMACDSLTDIVSVEGIAVLLEKTIEGEKHLVLSAGSGLIDVDEQMSAILYDRLEKEINSGKEALLDSEVDSPFKYEWPGSIKNIISVPLCGKDKQGAHLSQGSQNNSRIIGLMVAINRLDKPDFDSTDVKLFDSVANGCAVFVENGRLFSDLKELFIGSLKALTSSIDAKDQYTRGHSERVAFISRWIAEKIAAEELLEEEQIHRIYLAGLLHDIGKIGIDEAVLRKEGKLTEQELDRIRVHPSIGAGILSEIKQMRDIVPGVLSHHERVDGKGYPDGLVDEQIPLIAKIIGLADSFDAMTSKRVYRDAMTVEQALAEVEKGLGTQFDEKVGRVFINSDVYHLWSIIQDGFSRVYGGSDSVEYGTVAIGSIIR